MTPPATRLGNRGVGAGRVGGGPRRVGIGAGVADDGFTAFFQGAYPRIVGQLRLLTGDLASAEDIAQEAFIRAASRWRQRLPAEPEPAGRSPSQSWGAERALLRVEERANGAIEVHVLAPARR